MAGEPVVRTAAARAAVGFGIAFGSYLALALWRDHPLFDAGSSAALPIDPGAWIAFVWSLVFGYNLAAGILVASGSRAEINSMAPLVDDPERAFEGFARFDARGGMRRAWSALGALLMALGLVYTAFQMLAAPDLPTFALLFATEFTWFIAFVPLIGWQLGRFAYLTIANLRLACDMLASHVEIDLLRPEHLGPFTRLGLRNALSWIIGMTLISLLLLGTPEQYSGAVYLLIPTTLGLSVLALLIPLRGARAAVRSRKLEVLAALASEIARDRAKVASLAADAHDAAARLPGLIAYRGLVEGVREWPLDGGAAIRFLAYLVLPVAGWVGAALVERSVDLWLG